MKFILNFHHKIEKYGFKCLEFGNAHPSPGAGLHLHNPSPERHFSASSQLSFPRLGSFTTTE